MEFVAAHLLAAHTFSLRSPLPAGLVPAVHSTMSASSSCRPLPPAPPERSSVTSRLLASGWPGSSGGGAVSTPTLPIRFSDAT